MDQHYGEERNLRSLCPGCNVFSPPSELLPLCERPKKDHKSCLALCEHNRYDAACQAVLSTVTEKSQKDLLSGLVRFSRHFQAGLREDCGGISELFFKAATF